MKILFSEYNAKYEDYEFPYQIYALREEDDSLNEIYGSGFLPTRIDERLYYLSRSLRISIPIFELNSENRRISRKTSDVKLTIHNLKDFNYDFTIGKFAKDFYDKRFGEKTMSAQKVKWLFTSGAMTHVAVFEYKKEVVGYCLLNIDDEGAMAHYAYPFYKDELNSINLGIGMMLKVLEYAKENDFDYVYLGTVYSEKSLYKTQFEGIEYFTGMGWSTDLEQLKQQIREPLEGHLFQHIAQKNLFIDQLLQS